MAAKVKFIWKGIGPKIVRAAVLNRLSSERRLATQLISVSKLRGAAQKQFSLPGFHRCRAPLITLDGSPWLKCYKWWCPYCYARKLLKHVNGMWRMKVLYKRMLLISVESWVMPRRLLWAPGMFDPKFQQVWGTVGPRRPPWAAKKQARGFSWTIIEPIPDSADVRVTRRTAGTGVKDGPQFNLGPKKTRWGGLFEGRVVKRLHELDELADLFAYPVSWLQDEAFMEGFLQAQTNTDGNQRRWIEIWRTRDKLPELDESEEKPPVVERPPRRRRTKAEIREAAIKDLKDFMRKNKVPECQLPDHSRELLGLPPREDLVVNNEMEQ